MEDWLPPRRVLFQHLRKTGGTTLIALFGNFMRPAALQPHDPNASARFAATRADWAFVHGHSGLLMQLRTERSFAFTFLRRPLPRLLSERRQWMQAQAENIESAPASVAAATLALRHAPVAEILGRLFEFPVAVTSFWNHQTLTLGVWQGQMLAPEEYDRNFIDLHRHFPDNASFCAWLERNRYAILKNARANLRSLDYVGISEDFEDSTRELFLRLGLPEPPVIPRLNARERFPDEDDEGLKELARPFIDLDEELYDEALELHARQGRAVRGAPINYLDHYVAANEDKSYAADEPPGGHGWHEPARRADGKWSRWTGPGTESHFSLRLDRGTYRVELSIFGGVSERAIRTLALSLDGAPLATAIAPLADGSWLASAELSCAEAGIRTLTITVAATVNGHGVEVASLRVASLGVGDGEAEVSRAPSP